MRSLDAGVSGLAAAQHGVFSLAQVRDLGATKGMLDVRLRSGRWERVHRCVFRIAGSPETPLQRLKAAELAARVTAAICGPAAAFLLRMIEAEPPSIDVVASRQVQRQDDGVRFHHRPIPKSEIVVVEGIRVTNAARTLLDIAHTVPEEQLELMLDAALRRKLASVKQLRWLLRRWTHLQGAPILRRLVEMPQRGKSDSDLETLVAQLLRREGFTSWVWNERVLDAEGNIIRPDFEFPGCGVIIEALGYEFHGSKEAWARDVARVNNYSASRKRVVFVTWADMDNPDAVTARIEAALVATGAGPRG